VQNLKDLDAYPAPNSATPATLLLFSFLFNPVLNYVVENKHSAFAA
jgi:hypothetical protein